MKFRVQSSDDIKPVAAQIAALLNDKKVAGVEVKEWRPPRSNPQLKLIHAIRDDFARSQTCHPREMEVRLKHWLGWTHPIQKGDGTVIDHEKSWGKATSAELSDQIDRLIALADEYGVELNMREPDE